MGSAMMLPPRKPGSVKRVKTNVKEKASAFSSICEDASSPNYRSHSGSYKFISLPYIRDYLEAEEKKRKAAAKSQKVKRKSLFR